MPGLHFFWLDNFQLAALAFLLPTFTDNSNSSSSWAQCAPGTTSSYRTLSFQEPGSDWPELSLGAGALVGGRGVQQALRGHRGGPGRGRGGGGTAAPHTGGKGGSEEETDGPGTAEASHSPAEAALPPAAGLRRQFATT